MNSNQLSACHGFLVALLVALAPGLLHATLSEPDNVLYGAIVVGTNTITAQHTNYVVEVRRDPAGPAISSYRMGGNPGFGDHYSMNVAIEALDLNSYVNPGLVDTNASLPGDGLFLIVRDRNIIRYQTNFVVGVPGSFQRIDFGTAPPSSPIDQWQQFHFGAAGLNMNSDPLGKGQSLNDDYVAGTDPNDHNSRFQLTITGNAAPEISFYGIRAEGPGYAGLTRLYSLEESTNVLAGPWLGVPGYTNIVGNNLSIIYTAPTNAVSSRFYRASVRLQ